MVKRHLDKDPQKDRRSQSSSEQKLTQKWLAEHMKMPFNEKKKLNK